MDFNSKLNFLIRLSELLILKMNLYTICYEFYLIKDNYQLINFFTEKNNSHMKHLY